jgi:DNA primase large subunit
MIRQDFSRIDPKRKNTLGHRQKQWAQPTYQDVDYPHRLNFYTIPPTADITLEQFEQWAIDRLRGMEILRTFLFLYLVSKNHFVRKC